MSEARKDENRWAASAIAQYHKGREDLASVCIDLLARVEPPGPTEQGAALDAWGRGVISTARCAELIGVNVADLMALDKRLARVEAAPRAPEREALEDERSAIAAGLAILRSAAEGPEQFATGYNYDPQSFDECCAIAIEYLAQRAEVVRATLAPTEQPKDDGT